MMNYELAKELEAAGFPEMEGWVDGAMPTLEELIEACGVGLVSLYHNDNEWLVNEEAGSEVPQVRGSTLIIAVASLWLALNKK